MTTTEGPTIRTVLESPADVAAFDEAGNPLGCISCGVTELWVLLNAARLEGRQCGCPVPDARLVHINWLADAKTAMTRALDCLERLDHPLTCTCPACEATRALTETR